MYIDFLSFFSFLIYYFFLSVYILMAFPSTTKKSAVIRSKSSCWKNVFLFFFSPFLLLFFCASVMCIRWRIRGCVSNATELSSDSSSVSSEETWRRL